MCDALACEQQVQYLIECKNPVELVKVNNHLGSTEKWKPCKHYNSQSEAYMLHGIYIASGGGYKNVLKLMEGNIGQSMKAFVSTISSTLSC